VKFDLKKPCPGCPFLRTGPDVVRLLPDRIPEVWATSQFDGPNLPCHKTVDYDAIDDGEGEDAQITKDTQHCVGAILSGLASETGPNQLSRIMGRLGALDIDALESQIDLVFASEEEMMESALDRKTHKPKKKRAR